MAGSTFGKLFRVTTWGESHGKGIGVVVDGCPAGLQIDFNILLSSSPPIGPPSLQAANNVATAKSEPVNIFFNVFI